MKNLIVLSCFCIALSSCSGLQKIAKKDFNDGFYTQRIAGANQKVYVEIDNETVRINATKKVNNQQIIDTTKIHALFTKEINVNINHSISLSNASLDIDFLTIPLKYRASETNVPKQLNTNLNGAVYLGYRTDRYILSYAANAKGKANRMINHLGISMGAFTGLGNSFMSPTTTNNILQQEYDGLVWSKGIAAIFAVNNFTLGLALGFDHLLDQNRSIWIYESKPWLGLAFGLNLN